MKTRQENYETLLLLIISIKLFSKKKKKNHFLKAISIKCAIFKLHTILIDTLFMIKFLNLALETNPVHEKENLQISPVLSKL